MASRQGERNKYLADFEDGAGWAEIIRQPSPTNPYQKKSRVFIKKRFAGDEVHLLCQSAGRQEKDRAIREKQESRLLKDLQKLSGRVGNGKLKKESSIHEAIGRLKERYPRVARYYDISYDSQAPGLTWKADEDRKEKAKNLDGSYLLKTDRQDISDEEIWRIYILLTRVESAFRAMKSPLSERPIFHHLEHRVQTHIFLCVLAYHLLIAIEKMFLDAGVHTSWGTVREELKTHQVVTVILPASNGDRLKIRQGSTPEEAHRQIYQTLGLSAEILRPVKTWIRKS